MGIVLAILAFGFMIMIHEWGHFIMARRCGVRVLEFAFGMGPRILSHISKKSGTIYSWRLFPIGGFCQMLGEEGGETQGGNEQKLLEESRNAASSSGEGGASASAPEAIPEDSFAAKKVWQRILIVAAGPVINILTALIIGFFLTLFYGYSSPVVQKLDEGYHAAEAGMEIGDELLKIGSRTIHTMNDVSYALMEVTNDDAPVEVMVLKTSGEKKTLEVLPKLDEETESYRLGITIGSHHRGLSESENIFSMLGPSLTQSYWEMIGNIEMVFRSLGMLFTGRAGVNQMMGPIGIVDVMGKIYDESTSTSGFVAGILTLLSFVSMLSVNLGVMNLFPIPALDGSRLVFLALEGIRRKPVSQKVENIIYMIGFFLLIGLMIFTAGQDILRLIFKF